METKAQHFITSRSHFARLARFAYLTKTQFLADYITGYSMRMAVEEVNASVIATKAAIIYSDGSVNVIKNCRWTWYMARTGHVLPFNASRSALWNGKEWVIQVDLAIEKLDPKESWDPDAYAELIREAEDPSWRNRPANWFATVAIQKVLHGEDPDKARPPLTGDEEKDHRVSSILEDLGYGNLTVKEQ